jgi:penicillin-binding protein-related factor A (putative recombinase)
MPLNEQLAFAGVERLTPHANRGRLFQGILQNTHTWYERQHWGKLYEIPNAFSYVNEWRWSRAEPELRARTEVYFVDIKGRKERRGGAPLLRVKSAPDYLGGLLGYHLEFDAKEFAGPSISIENFKEHQVDNLYSSERAGNIAGFMVLEKRTSNVYWVSASWARAWRDNVRMNRSGVAKSLNFSKVADARIRLLCQVERTSLAHYAPALIPSFKLGSKIAA